jgi:hypothetical protein
MLQGYGGFIILLIGPTCGSASLISSSIKPWTGESLLRDLKKLNLFLETQDLEKFGISKEPLVLTIPSLLVDIATSGPETIDELAKGSKGVLFGGAGLPDKVGDFLAENGVNILVGYGM